jgi:hypothetical protein
MQKVALCERSDCQQTCLSPLFSGYICAAIGSCAVALYSLNKTLGGYKYFVESGVNTAQILFPLLALLVAVLVCIYLFSFERFEHWYSAVLFGASIPAFLVAVPAINSPGQ